MGAAVALLSEDSAAPGEACLLRHLRDAGVSEPKNGIGTWKTDWHGQHEEKTRQNKTIQKQFSHCSKASFVKGERCENTSWFGEIWMVQLINLFIQFIYWVCDNSKVTIPRAWRDTKARTLFPFTNGGHSSTWPFICALPRCALAESHTESKARTWTRLSYMWCRYLRWHRNHWSKHLLHKCNSLNLLIKRQNNLKTQALLWE